MATFDKGVLESHKYADLVKLAKENGVYRRYAPKAELIEKLLALNESPPETLSDVSMPSFTDDESDSETSKHGTENTSPHDKTVKPNLTWQHEEQLNKRSKVATFSPRHPLSEKKRFLNSSSISLKNESPTIYSCKSDNSQPLRRSLAGPAKSINTGVKRGKCLKTTEIERKPKPSPDPASRRITRQRTFDTYAHEPTQSHQMKREGTFEVIEDKEEACNKKASSHSMRREGTFEVENLKSLTKTSSNTRTSKLTRESTFEVEDNAQTVQSHTLRREGTFEVEEVKNSTNDSHKSKLRREGTFEVDTVSNLPAEMKLRSRSSNARLTPSCVSETKKPARGSLRTPYQPKIISVATPSSIKCTFGYQRQNITSRARVQELTSSAKRLSGSKSKIPSVINEIQRKKAEVSTQKMASTSTGFKPTLAKKAPDFNAIHNRLFDKMESIADSVQKVKDRAFSSQKLQVKSGKKSPPKAKAVRKLLSPKVGKSKLVSPKPLFQNIGSAFASKVVSIQKRPSTGSVITGVSKLQSPKPEQNIKRNGFASNFGFTKAEHSRKEAFKASVMGRKPMKRNSPMSKAKHALNTVRLNKRFELQMKHRIAQQAKEDS
ncbi:uncharacterized protein LOC113211187 [Frankliniella occidentalis]|uniref:Uncharacterized protein LOC113211187 n=1 Tax=Frankliniella occidentalis TaxID=133901 RepID=A0A6J1SVH8_FRAOC|nr:uncharacterized protein LOC113211187 [Frankliniella occidentalis]